MFALLTLIQVNNLLFIMLFAFSMVLYRKYCQYNVGKKRLKVTKKLCLFVTEETQFCVNGGLHTDLNQRKRGSYANE